MVGIGREDNSANVPLKFSKKFAVWAAVKPFRSFKSAPAQKQLSTSLASITALVGPLSSTPAAPPYIFVGGASLPSGVYSEAMEETASRSSERRATEMAFRAEGRESVRILMRPVCGAGRSWIFIKRSACAEYARRTILGSEDERDRIRGRIVKRCFVVVSMGIWGRG